MTLTPAHVDTIAWALARVHPTIREQAAVKLRLDLLAGFSTCLPDRPRAVTSKDFVDEIMHRIEARVAVILEHGPMPIPGLDAPH